MEKPYKNERLVNLEEITARHKSREIEGCTSWRHFAVHQDRAWLLNSLEKARSQVESIRQAANDPAEKSAFESELNALLGMFEAEKLNHLGDETP